MFPSGRMGLVSQSGNIMATINVKENSKKGIVSVKPLGFISPYDSNGLARINVNVPILRRANTKNILATNPF